MKNKLLIYLAVGLSIIRIYKSQILKYAVQIYIFTNRLLQAIDKKIHIKH